MYCPRQRCSPRSVVSGDIDISFMPIFVGVRWGGGVKCECGRQKCEFSLSIATSSVRCSDKTYAATHLLLAAKM